MIVRHRLPFESFEALCAGTGDRTGLTVLAASQRSKRYLLLRMVVDRLPSDQVSTGPTADALGLLAEVRRRDRSALDEVFSYPYVGAGLVRCLRALRAGHGAAASGQYLAVTSATAAVRAGVDFELEVGCPAAAPVLHLPGLGSVRIDQTQSAVGIAQRGGRATVGGVVLPIGPDAARHTDAWRGLRPLADPAVDGFAAVLDDLDPDRGTGGLPAAAPLGPERFADWHALFARAWVRLNERHGRWVGQLRRVVRAVTPLDPQTPGQGRSASTWQAYGAVALTPPGDELSLAATLVHETQHSKLNGLLDLVDLYDRADETLYYSPWRADPRPLRGLLHGCYAFLGVADFWADEHAADPGSGRGGYELARSILQLRRALETLSEATGLTADGRFLVAQMSRHLAALAGGTASPEPVQHLAELATDDHYVSWRFRTLVPDPDVVASLADSWRTGRAAAPGLPETAQSAPVAETFVPNERIRLWNRLARGVDGHPSAADRLLVKGAFGAAARRYQRMLDDDPEDIGVWTGLTLAAARLDGPAADIWHNRPELVRAVHHAIQTHGGEAPDPLILAGWLAAGLAG